MPFLGTSVNCELSAVTSAGREVPYLGYFSGL